MVLIEQEEIQNVVENCLFYEPGPEGKVLADWHLIKESLKRVNGQYSGRAERNQSIGVETRKKALEYLSGMGFVNTNRVIFRTQGRYLEYESEAREE